MPGREAGAEDMTKQRVNDFSQLPLSVRDIAETLGLDVVIKLVDHFGGCELFIPSQLKPDHPLMALGEEAAQALVGYCPKDRIDVPKSLNPRPTASTIEVLESRGLTRNQIARELNITQRHVRRVANGKDTSNPDQTNLFD